MSTNEKIGIIGPTFFGYAEAIESMANSMGYDVTFFNERSVDTFFVKALYRSKTLKNIFQKKLMKDREVLIRNIVNMGIQRIIYISPEFISDEDFRICKSAKVKTQVYMDLLKTNQLQKTI